MATDPIAFLLRALCREHGIPLLSNRVMGTGDAFPHGG